MLVTYEEALNAIHGRKTFSSTASLERISRLMARLGNPQNAVRCVHVAGTNGKGSVCAMVESALRRAGYRVGLFTSPYLVDFRERIQIDRTMISRERLIDCCETVLASELALEAEGYEPVNEFEFVMAMGFLAFAMAQVDYAVVEVGLGGRCDPTNVIQAPAVCCITSISLDHTAVLGGTVAEIAAEKAGIIKTGCPVVIARQTEASADVIRRTAERLGAPVVQTAPPEAVRNEPGGLNFRYGEHDVSLPLLGRYQAENGAAAWEVCKCLGLSEETIRAGFQTVRWPGRLQLISGEPDLLIDAGHNPAGIQSLCDTLDELFRDREIVAVMAMMRDKDYAQCVPMVAERCCHLVAASVDLPRSLPPEELADTARSCCPAETAGSVLEGMRRARELAGPRGLVVVCGSVYAAGAALTAIS